MNKWSKRQAPLMNETIAKWQEKNRRSQKIRRILYDIAFALFIVLIGVFALYFGLALGAV